MRRSFTLFSILVHAVVISAALIAQVLAIGKLPTPHQPILFEAADIMPADIKLPKPPQRASPSPSSEASASINAAPLSPPSGVAPESTREGEPTTSNGLVPGVVNGLPEAVDGLDVDAMTPPPPLPPPSPVPVRLHAGIKAPRKIADAPPVYPALARTAHVQGVVILEAVIDAQGSVASVRVLRSIALLDNAAMEAVQQWKFTPALLNNEPVPVVMTVTVNFMLEK
jgi:periplasmic protein TonB